MSQQLPLPAWAWTCCSGDSATQWCWELPHCQPANSPMHPITLPQLQSQGLQIQWATLQKACNKKWELFYHSPPPLLLTSNLSPWDYVTKCICAHAQDKSHTQSNSGKKVLLLRCPLFRKRWPCNTFSSIKFARSKLLKFSTYIKSAHHGQWNSRNSFQYSSTHFQQTTNLSKKRFKPFLVLNVLQILHCSV